MGNFSKLLKISLFAVLQISIASAISAVEIDPIEIEIEFKSRVFQGGHATATILNRTSPQNNLEIGGFDFLIGFDASALTFVGALEGSVYDRCEWEYFTYRYGQIPPCDSCPSGTLRIISIAETNNGSHRPSCNNFVKGDTLAVLDFLVSDDRTLECAFIPIKFFWNDFRDNTISTKTGDTIFVSQSVFDSDTCDITEITDSTTGYSTYTGTQPDYLDSTSLWHDVVRQIHFYNGGFETYCSWYYIDGRGDINLNEISYEEADLAMFRDWFLNGLSAFDVNVQGQIAASDVNQNGIPLEVSDYIFIQVYGDTLSIPQPCKPLIEVEQWPDPAYFMHDSINNKVTIESTAELGAAFLIFDGHLTSIQSNASAECGWAFDGDSTRIFLYSDSMTSLDINVPIITYTADLPVTLIHTETATIEGGLVQSLINGATSVEEELVDPEQLLPSKFSLEQNYPNPFNGYTVIRFELPKTSEVELEIVNLLGQVVKSWKGRFYVGKHEVYWNAKTVNGHEIASGIYYYRLTTEDNSSVRKMLYLK